MAFTGYSSVQGGSLRRERLQDNREEACLYVTCKKNRVFRRGRSRPKTTIPRHEEYKGEKVAVPV